jgi:hypothetical protein
METTVEHAARAPEDAVHGTREPSRDAFHASRQGLLATRFHDQVRVIALQRVVRHAELPALAGRGQGTLKLAHQAAGTKRRNAAQHAHRDVHRTCARNRLALAVQYPRSGPRRSTRARARPAATRTTTVVGEAELSRDPSHAH